MFTVSTLPERGGSVGYHHGDLRAALVRAALELLCAGGPAASEPSLRAVARRAGVSPNAAYRHFDDKAALLAAVAAEGFREVERGFRAVAADRAAAPDLAAERMFSCYLDFARAKPALYRLMFDRAGLQGTTASAELEREADACFDRAVEIVRRLVRPGAARAAARRATVAVWSLAHGYAALRSSLNFEGEPVEEIPGVVDLARVVLDGVGAVADREDR